MSEKFNTESERRGASEEVLEKARGILKKAQEEGKILWEENAQEFIIKFPEWHRKYSKHNPLKAAEAERNIEVLKKNPGLHETTEDENTYSLTTFDRVIHIPKWEEISLSGFVDGKLDVDKMIKVFLENPAAGEKGEISETAQKIKAEGIKKE